MTIVVLPAERFKLSKGTHGTKFKGEACVKELQTIAMGERFSDKPACISPIIDRLEIALNDRLPDGEQRDRLLPFAYRALGTRGDGRDEERRQMCNEWLLHHALPTLLDKAGKAEAAARLRSLPDDLAVEGVRRAIYEARDEARDARRTAVEKLRAQILAELKKRNAAGAEAEAAAAAGAAAAAAAEAVAGAAAVAAAAAEAAAVAVAAAEAAAAGNAYREIRTAVRYAVYAKVRELFKPTSDELIDGAFDLLDRMLPPAPLKPPVIENAEAVFGVAA